jgi:acid phosphatase
MRRLLLIATFALACTPHKAPRGDTGPGGLSTTGSGVIVIGDQGTGKEEQKEVADSIVTYCEYNLCDFGVTLGDNIYEKGVKDTKDPQWETKFETPYQEIEFTLYPSLGNHDHYGNWKAQVDYKSKRWNMPARYYKVSVAMVDFFAIDTQKVDSAQLKWLEKNLRASTKPWKVVYGHKPPYSSGMHGENSKVKSDVVPLLEKYDVDLFLGGHDHHLELLENNDVVYAISGAAGKLRPLIRSHKYSEWKKSNLGFLHLQFMTDKLVLSFIDTNEDLLKEHIVKK